MEEGGKRANAESEAKRGEQREKSEERMAQREAEEAPRGDDREMRENNGERRAGS